MLLLIDNFDSFTFNLLQSFAELGQQVVVRRPGEVELEDCSRLAPDYLVLGPGPGRPEDAVLTLELIEALAGKLPILGVCLGHQAIAHVCGAHVRQTEPMHGKVVEMHHNNEGLLKGLPKPFLATRYHSLLVDAKTLPADLRPTVWTASGEIMGIQHIDMPLFGIQFHPESILTTVGSALLNNFLNS